MFSSVLTPAHTRHAGWVISSVDWLQSAMGSRMQSLSTFYEDTSGPPSDEACDATSSSSSDMSYAQPLSPVSRHLRRRHSRRRMSNSRPIVDILHYDGGIPSPGDLPYSLPGVHAAH